MEDSHLLIKVVRGVVKSAVLGAVLLVAMTATDFWCMRTPGVLGSGDFWPALWIDVTLLLGLPTMLLAHALGMELNLGTFLNHPLVACALNGLIGAHIFGGFRFIWELLTHCLRDSTVEAAQPNHSVEPTGASRSAQLQVGASAAAGPRSSR